jgi:hypothetical protein
MTKTMFLKLRYPIKLLILNYHIKMKRGAGMKNRFPRLEKYTDYRVAFEQMKNK